MLVIGGEGFTMGLWVHFEVHNLDGICG
jgi:hypothetical protein